uniref:Uncharacterized protein n=1 Tax=Romanomermis culicivorax TaxID=13658 RepID=A0A915JHN2_ROMCU
MNVRNSLDDKNNAQKTATRNARNEKLITFHSSIAYAESSSGGGSWRTTRSKINEQIGHRRENRLITAQSTTANASLIQNWAINTFPVSNLKYFIVKPLALIVPSARNFIVNLLVDVKMNLSGPFGHPLQLQKVPILEPVASSPPSHKELINNNA